MQIFCIVVGLRCPRMDKQPVFRQHSEHPKAFVSRLYSQVVFLCVNQQQINEDKR